MEKRRGREFWRETVADHEESGVPVAAFAALRGLNANTLSWWRWRLRNERREQNKVKADGLVEVTSVALPVVVSGTPCTARPAAGVMLRVGTGVTLAFDGLPPVEYVAHVARCYDEVAS